MPFRPAPHQRSAHDTFFARRPHDASDAAPRSWRDRRTSLVVDLLVLVALVAIVTGVAGAQVRPIFEVYATATGNTVGRAGDAAYARLGDVRGSPALGLGLGVMGRGFDVVLFGETGSVPIRGIAAPEATTELTRNAVGLRIERPLFRLPAGFAALGAVSGLWQEFEPVAVRGTTPAPDAPLVPITAGTPGSVRLDAQAWGGRLEVGVEHRAFLGSAWYLLGGVTAMRDGGGSAADLAGGTARGWRAVPVISLGVRSRGW
jgi:hypothetical protein